jgi:hypothetical protein
VSLFCVAMKGTLQAPTARDAAHEEQTAHVRTAEKQVCCSQPTPALAGLSWA